MSTLSALLSPVTVLPVINPGMIRGTCISEQKVTTPQSAIRFTGLNSLTDGDYILEIKLVSLGPAVAALYVNGDTWANDSSYRCHRHYSNAGSAYATDMAQPQVIDYGNNEYCMGTVSIKVVNGYFFYSSVSMTILTLLTNPLPYTFQYSGCKTVALTGGAITQLQFLIANGTATIGAGSSFTLYGTKVAQNLVTFDPQDYSSYTSDRLLKVGETAYINYTAKTSLPLNIQTEEGEYEVRIIGDLTGSTGGEDWARLKPNNTSYTGAFSGDGIKTGTDGSNAIQNIYNQDGFVIGLTLIMKSVMQISTYTKNKGMTHHTAFKRLSGSLESMPGISYWGDTTTLWTSLGTLTFPFAQSGKVIVRRLL